MRSTMSGGEVDQHHARHIGPMAVGEQQTLEAASGMGDQDVGRSNAAGLQRGGQIVGQLVGRLDLDTGVAMAVARPVPGTRRA